MPIETRLLADRRVFLSGEITAETADNFTRQILFLNCESQEQPIDVWISSPGGEVIAGLKIYDVIQSSPAPVRMICCGEAASFAAVLFISGRHGRYMFPHSRLMVHEPQLGGKISGNTTSIRSIADSLQEMKQKLNGILALHSGRTPEEIEAATAYDHFMDPDEAISFGFCDAVTSLTELMEENA